MTMGWNPFWNSLSKQFDEFELFHEKSSSSEMISAHLVIFMFSYYLLFFRNHLISEWLFGIFSKKPTQKFDEILP